MVSRLLTLIAIVIGFTACSPMPNPTEGEKNIIGDKLKDVSSLTNEQGQSQSFVALYDPTVNRIHQFDLNKFQLNRSVPVGNPGVEHYVLYDQGGNYLVDLAEKNLTLFDNQGTPYTNMIQFVGNPKSAAFRPGLGLLVVYDDLMSVGILKIDQYGRPDKSWVGGGLVGGLSTIAAGDIDETGRLILATSNNSIMVVNLDQTLTQHSWSITKTFSVPLTNITWLAPVKDYPNLAYVIANGKLALINLSTETIVSERSISGYSQLAYSKAVNPHVVLRDGNELVIAYVSNSQIVTRSIYHRVDYIAKSRLDIANDSLILVDIPYGNWDWYKSSTQKNRVVRSWRFSDLLARHKFAIRDNSKLEVTDQALFSLYPSKLGYAAFYDLQSGQTKTFEKFNLPFIK